MRGVKPAASASKATKQQGGEGAAAAAAKRGCDDVGRMPVRAPPPRPERRRIPAIGWREVTRVEDATFSGSTPLSARVAIYMSLVMGFTGLAYWIPALFGPA